jgi:hypothetical protein
MSLVSPLSILGWSCHLVSTLHNRSPRLLDFQFPHNLENAIFQSLLLWLGLILHSSHYWKS